MFGGPANQAALSQMHGLVAVPSVMSCVYKDKCPRDYSVVFVPLGELESLLNESNKRGDWMMQWFMIRKFVALNTMHKKLPDKQATFRSSNGKDKQLDYVLVDRKSMRYCRDAEANDRVHMGSDHRCVVTRFTFPGLKKSDSRQSKEICRISKKKKLTKKRAKSETKDDTAAANQQTGSAPKSDGATTGAKKVEQPEQEAAAATKEAEDAAATSPQKGAAQGSRRSRRSYNCSKRGRPTGRSGSSSNIEEAAATKTHDDHTKEEQPATEIHRGAIMTSNDDRIRKQEEVKKRRRNQSPH